MTKNVPNKAFFYCIKWQMTKNNGQCTMNKSQIRCEKEEQDKVILICLDKEILGNKFLCIFATRFI